MATPNMRLMLPTVGVTAGPQYATELNNAFTIIDLHDHTTGSGSPIPATGLNINADLSFQGNNATVLRSARFSAQPSIIADATDLNCLSVSGVDLYYNDGNGNRVRITQSGGVAGSPGSISSLASPASATYVGASKKFVWQAGSNLSANMDFGSAIMRNNVPSSFALTVEPPTLTNNYTITLPTLPSSQKIMTLDASGNMTAPYVVDNTGIEVSSNTIQLKNLGVTTAKLNDFSVTSAKIDSLAVTTAKINDGAVTQVKRAALGQQFSDSSGTWTASTTSFSQVTNLSINITTTGRPVFIGLISDNSAALGSIGVSSGADPCNAEFQIWNATSPAQLGLYALDAQSGGIGTIKVPSSSLWTISALAAGTYNITIRARVSATSSSRTVLVSNSRMIVYEL